MKYISKTKISEFIRRNIWIILALIILIAVISIIIVSLFYISYFNGGISIEHERWGTLGDFVGGILNPILSFLALIALLVTIILQSSELESTREELKLTRVIHEKTEKYLEEQANILKKQLEQTKQSLHSEYYFKVVNIIQDEDFRQIRRKVYTIYERTKYQDWNDGHKEMAEVICQKMDVIGNLLNIGILKSDMLIPSWYTLFIKCWNSTEELIKEKRKEEGIKFWSDFENLYSISIDHKNLLKNQINNK